MDGPIEIILQRNDGTSLDVSDYVADDDAITLTMEHERSRFEFVADDIDIRLSNIDGVVATFFGPLNRTSAWTIRVRIEDAFTWHGVISPESVETDEIGEWVRLSAFSITRAFWDWAEATRVRPNYAIGYLDNPAWINLTRLFNTEFLLRHNLTNRGLITGIDLTTFGSRNVRGFGDLTANNIGRFKELDPMMTWADFLKALSLYYNAVFYVDPFTRKFTMAKRSFMTGRMIEISNDVKDESAVQYNFLDDETIDYAKVVLARATVAPPEFVSRTRSLLANVPQGRNLYYVRYTDANGGTIGSDPPLAVDVPPRPSTFEGWLVTVRALGVAEATRKEVFVASIDLGYPDNGIVKIHESVGTTTTNVLDFGGRSGEALGQLSSTYMWYLRYASGVWDPPIPDWGGRAPEGNRILDLSIRIRFGEIGNVLDLREENMREVMAFFGNEMSFEAWTLAFADLFVSQRLVKFRIRGLDWRVGDLLLSEGANAIERLRTTSVRVRRVRANLLREECEIEGSGY